MFKKIGLIVFAVLLAHTCVYASHYMGGEITWQCLGNGNFRFMMKLYRECNGIPYADNENISVTGHPGLTSITMSLHPGGNPHDADDGVLDGKTDISPDCWSGTQEIHCSPAPSTANTGAVEEYYYTSDATYPNGIMISGTPPAGGWIFSHSSCCRNPSTNVLSATIDSWFLRTVMYPYQNLDTYPCYDNAPVFAETPATVICTGYPNQLNYTAYDEDQDSLRYEWAPALDGSIAVPVTYAAGYSYNNPLPDNTFNGGNIPAQLNPATGEVFYLSHTAGAFVAVGKISAYRCGIKIAEVFREMQFVLLNCVTPSNAPQVTLPFYNPVTGYFDSYEDTVYAGTTVEFEITGIDMDLLPGGMPETLTMESYSIDYGTGYSDSTAGCPFPPCATLSHPLPITGLTALSTHFTWKTNCEHAYSPLTCTTSGIRHNFIFKFHDNACPANGVNSITLGITVLPLPVMQAPVITTVDILTNGDITLHWATPPDPEQTFHAYYIYTSTSPNGPFILLDSVLSYTQTSYTHLAGDGNNVSHYYYMQSKSGCYGNVFSSPGDTIVSATFEGIAYNPDDAKPDITWDPEKRSVTILLPQETNATIELFNAIGQAVLHKTHYGKLVHLDLSAMPKGMYIISIVRETDPAPTVKKMVIP